MLIDCRAYRFVANIPKTLLVPLIGFPTLIGSFAIRNALSDTLIMVILGACGWGMMRLGFSPSPTY
ncbi:tripartite tricarboxylate transporter permease [Candidatus Persebacteraceae bacterium Df01]|jgi:putative tricarboxylic transport membrane protein|uniref:Tripartite tricarboxylate transporter permease n=1 Tax=Candidatus Doriopsillibacter californiensis TaxID=2970740 RepID=A0ABT7QKZ9_9GAMM|nr:tripartite tricarboxylate transporter permease [Candidatus Persebacteraceae bacterium Df01]